MPLITGTVLLLGKAAAIAAKAGAVAAKGAAVAGKGLAAGGKAVGGAAKVAGKKTISAAKVKGKKAVGSVKGRAKKIAKDKLLGRDKKKGRKFQRPQQEGEEQQQQEQQQERGGELARPTTSLLPSGPTGIVPSAAGALATTGDSGGAGGGDSAHAIAVSISSKIIRVEKLLKGSALIKKDIREDARQESEEEKDKAQEAALEKSKDPSAKKGPKLKLPGKGLLAKIFGFFGAVILGRIAMFVMDWLPVITPWLKKLGAFVDGVIDWSGKILDGLTRFIDFSYMLYDKATGWIKEQIGEEGAKKFDIFMGNLHKLIQGFLVWKIIGEKIFKAIISSIRNTWKIIKGAFVRAFKIARAALKAVWKLASKIPGVKQAVGWVGKQAGRAGGFIKGLGSKLLGGAGKAGAGVVGKVSGLAAKFFGPAAKTLGPVFKTVGPKIAKFAGRIPIIGPIIVAIVSLMSGEPLGQALFKGLGAALGGGLGAALAAGLAVGTAGLGALVAPAMTILGEMIGTFVGDLLYELFMGGGMKEVMNRLKGLVTGVFNKVLDIGKWLAGGFKRFIENFLVETAIEIPEGGGRHSAMTLAAKALGMFDWLKEIGYVNSDDRVYKFPNILQLYNPFKMLPLLKDSFFPPGGPKEAESSGGSSTSTAGGSADDPSKGLEKQEKELIAANQKGGYDGVMEKIESYAPYEDTGAGPIKVVAPSSKSASPTSDQSQSELITVGGGGGEDPYEVLEAFG